MWVWWVTWIRIRLSVKVYRIFARGYFGQMQAHVRVDDNYQSLRRLLLGRSCSQILYCGRYRVDLSNFWLLWTKEIGDLLLLCGQREVHLSKFLQV